MLRNGSYRQKLLTNSTCELYGSALLFVTTSVGGFEIVVDAP